MNKISEFDVVIIPTGLHWQTEPASTMKQVNDSIALLKNIVLQM